MDLLRKHWGPLFQEGRESSFQRKIDSNSLNEMKGVFGKEMERIRFEKRMDFAKSNGLIRRNENIDKIRETMGDKGLNILLLERIKERKMEGDFEKYRDKDREKDLEKMELLYFTMQEYGGDIPDSVRYLFFGQLRKLEQKGKCDIEVVEAAYKTLRGEDLEDKARKDLIFSEISKQVISKYQGTDVKKKINIGKDLKNAKEVLSEFTGEEISDLTILALLDAGFSLDQIAKAETDTEEKRKRWAPWQKEEISKIKIGEKGKEKELSLSKLNKVIKDSEEKFKQNIGEDFNNKSTKNKDKIKIKEENLTSVWEKANKKTIQDKKEEILKAEFKAIPDNLDSEYQGLKDDLVEKYLEKNKKKPDAQKILSGETGEAGREGIELFKKILEGMEGGKPISKDNLLEILEQAIGMKEGEVHKAIEKLNEKDKKGFEWLLNIGIAPFGILLFVIVGGLILMEQVSKEGKGKGK